MNSKTWYVYLALCSDGSYYCGITIDPVRREIEHNSGKGSKYTRSRRPIKLKSIVELQCRSDALKLEIFIKKLKKISKRQIFEAFI